MLPLAEYFIYKLSWPITLKQSAWALLLKKIYNKDVIGYSGELYFFLWSKKYLGISHKDAFSTIKDNNIISSAASTLFSLALLAIFALTGQIRFLDNIPNSDLVYLSIGIFLSVAVIILLIYFRKYIFGMGMDIAGKIFGLHIVRLSLGLVLQIVQWAVVMPEVPIYVWITLISVQIIMSRIPFLPNQDLIFMGLSMELSGMLEVSLAGIAGLMLANTLLGKGMNIIFFGFAGLKKDVAVIHQEALPQVENEEVPL